jgi:hypothetical protein
MALAYDNKPVIPCPRNRISKLRIAFRARVGTSRSVVQETFERRHTLAPMVRVFRLSACRAACDARIDNVRRFDSRLCPPKTN